MLAQTIFVVTQHLNQGSWTIPILYTGFPCKLKVGKMLKICFHVNKS